MTQKLHHDVIIVGGGAAGLSAGLVLARAQARVLLIDAGEPRNSPATEMHGFLSRDGIPPIEFLERGRAEFTEYGGITCPTTVSTTAHGEDGKFSLTLRDGTVQSARALLVATGLTDELPLVPGVRERWGTLVHHCPYCHGYEVLGKSVIVVGGEAKDFSLKQAGLVRRFSENVTFVTNGLDVTPAEQERLEAFGVPVIRGVVSHLNGEPGSLDGVELTDGATVPGEAIFIAPRPRPNDRLLRSLGCTIDASSGLIAVDQFGQTSVPGVWAAGNVVTPSAQVITAAGAGSASAIAINGWLLQKDLDVASAARP